MPSALFLERSISYHFCSRLKGPLCACLAVSLLGLGVRYRVPSLGARKISYGMVGLLLASLPPLLWSQEAWFAGGKDPLARYWVRRPLDSDRECWREGVSEAAVILTAGLHSELLERVERSFGGQLVQEFLTLREMGSCAGQTLALHEQVCSGGAALTSKELLQRVTWQRIAFFQCAHKLRCTLERATHPSCPQGLLQKVRTEEERGFQGAMTYAGFVAPWPLNSEELERRVVQSLPPGKAPVAGHIFLVPAERVPSAHVFWFQVRPISRIYDSAAHGGLFEFPAWNHHLLYDGLCRQIERNDQHLFPVESIFITLVSVDGGG